MLSNPGGPLTFTGSGSSSGVSRSAVSSFLLREGGSCCSGSKPLIAAHCAALIGSATLHLSPWT